MANVTVPVLDISVDEDITPSVEPTVVPASAADVLILPNEVGILKVVNSTGATVLTFAANANGGEAPACAVAASKTAYIKVEDTTEFWQSDGMLHVTTSAGLTSVLFLKH